MKEGIPRRVFRGIGNLVDNYVGKGEFSFEKKERGPWTKALLPTEVSAESDEVYINVSHGKVARTHAEADGLHIDYDADGDVVGIELSGFNIRRALEKKPPISS